MAVLDAAREAEHRRNKFAAALKGVDLDAPSKEESMDRVRQEMERLEEEQGLSSPTEEKQDEFAAFGIAVVEGD